jgi:hypothetical protein
MPFELTEDRSAERPKDLRGSLGIRPEDPISIVIPLFIEVFDFAISLN